MSDEAFIEFLRKVAEIPTSKEICLSVRGHIFATEHVPEWFDALVRAAQEAVKKIEEAKE